MVISSAIQYEMTIINLKQMHYDKAVVPSRVDGVFESLLCCYQHETFHR